MKKKLMWAALVVFAATSGLAAVVNSLLGTGLRFDYTISRYVGLETWSVVIFALGNFVVAGSMLKYLFGVIGAWKMPRWLYWVVVVMSICLVGLSVCPIGYFDPVGAKYGTSAPSLIHGMCSRTMFMLMMLVMGMVAFSKMASKRTRILAVVFVMYGIFCVWGYLCKIEWFGNTVLIFESLYLFSFLVLCLALKSKGEENGRPKR